MKKFIIGLTILTSMTSYAYNCESELEKNTASMQSITQLDNVTEGQRSILFEMNANTRQSIELACGLKEVEKVDPLAEVEESRQKILNMEGISEAQRSILLEMNANTRRVVELSL
ncbi:MAG: hypothetical protein QF441_15005 [Bacteriovoracaceae bacterium]|jgi:hypothetical protein|nr:hypothetical protein [Bacteriovoracaceae bacterium]